MLPTESSPIRRALTRVWFARTPHPAPRTAITVGRCRTEKSKPRFWGNPTQKPRVKKIFLEHLLRFIQKPISSLPDHFGIGAKMTSKFIFFTLGFWFELPQILGLGFRMCQPCYAALGTSPVRTLQMGRSFFPSLLREIALQLFTPVLCGLIAWRGTNSYSKANPTLTLPRI